MSNLKRFLALTLSILMIVSGLALNVGAAPSSNFTDVADETLGAALDLLKELGIVQGTTTTTFGGSSPVTREQFASFVARIHSAKPDRFLNAGRVYTGFADDALIDTAHSAAVDYVKTYDIVRGKSGNLFDPKGEINFNEAVTMLVRALGRSSFDNIPYPIGFLIKAEDMGLIGDDATFTMDGVGGVDVVTRNDMGKLVFNFLMGEYEETKLTINPNGTISGTTVEKEPVLATFGIIEQVGYVTGAKNSNFTASIVLPEFAGIKATGAGTFTFSGALGTSPGYVVVDGVRTEKDIAITYGDISDGTLVQSTDIKTLRGVKKTLGFTEEDEYLVGLKVAFYTNAKGTEIDSRFPARVIGSKTEVTKPSAVVVYKDGNVASDIADVTSVTLDRLLTGDDWKFLNPDFNLYSATGRIFSPVGGGNYGIGEDNAKEDLARLALSGNARIEYVWNGIDSDGFDEYYYIVRPYEVAIYESFNDGYVFSSGKLHKDSKIDYPLGAAAIETGHAYFFVNYGATSGAAGLVEVYGKLERETGVTITARNEAKVSYKSTDATAITQVNFDDKQINRAALGAIDATAAKALGLGADRILFSSKGLVLLVKVPGQGPDPDWATEVRKLSDYGVVAVKDIAWDNSNPNEFTNEDSAYKAFTTLADGKLNTVAMARLLTVSSGAIADKEISGEIDSSTVTALSGNPVAVDSALINALSGKLLKLNGVLDANKNPVANKVLTVATAGGVAPAANGKNFYTEFEYLGKSGTSTGSDLGAVTLSGSLITVGGTGAGAVERSAVVNANTKFVIYSSNTGTPGTAGSQTGEQVKIYSLANFRTALAKTGFGASVEEAILIGYQESKDHTMSSTYVGLANVVFINTTMTHGDLAPQAQASGDVFGIILSQKNNVESLVSDSTKSISIYEVAVFRNNTVVKEDLYKLASGIAAGTLVNVITTDPAEGSSGNSYTNSFADGYKAVDPTQTTGLETAATMTGVTGSLAGTLSSVTTSAAAFTTITPGTVAFNGLNKAVVKLADGTWTVGDIINGGVKADNVEYKTTTASGSATYALSGVMFRDAANINLAFVVFIGAESYNPVVKTTAVTASGTITGKITVTLTGGEFVASPSASVAVSGTATGGAVTIPDGSVTVIEIAVTAVTTGDVTVTIQDAAFAAGKRPTDVAIAFTPAA